MVLSDKKAAARFGERLRAAMSKAGHVSHGNRSGVDVAKLAAASHTTYEMARRYAEGIAMPRPDKLEAIARWLGVRASELAFGIGAAGPGSAVDEGTLQQCIEAVIKAQRKAGRQLSPESTAHLAAVLYAEATTGELPSPESVALLVRAST